MKKWTITFAVLIMAIAFQASAGVTVLQGVMSAGDLTVSVTNTTGRPLLVETISSTMSATSAAISTGTYHKVTSYDLAGTASTANTLILATNFAVGATAARVDITGTTPLFSKEIVTATRLANASTSTVQIVDFICVDP